MCIFTNSSINPSDKYCFSYFVKCKFYSKALTNTVIFMLKESTK